MKISGFNEVGSLGRCLGIPLLEKPLEELISTIFWTKLLPNSQVGKPIVLGR